MSPFERIVCEREMPADLLTATSAKFPSSPRARTWSHASAWFLISCFFLCCLTRCFQQTVLVDFPTAQWKALVTEELPSRRDRRMRKCRQCRGFPGAYAVQGTYLPTFKLSLGSERDPDPLLYALVHPKDQRSLFPGAIRLDEHLHEREDPNSQDLAYPDLPCPFLTEHSWQCRHGSVSSVRPGARVFPNWDCPKGIKNPLKSYKMFRTSLLSICCPPRC